MILFLSDWDKYPGAIVHTKTKNETALRLAYIYKSMGVKNHLFHLALHDPDLQDVDPHNIENLDMATMTKIINECQENPWYYFREIARIRPSGSFNSVPLRLNRANTALYWMFFNHIFTMLFQPRQTGKSISTDVLAIGILNFFTVNTFINLLTANDSLREINLNRLKSLQDELPFYLDMRDKKSIFNSEIIRMHALKNTYKGNVSNASPKLANSVGRGFTSPILFVDEGIIVPNIKIAMEAALMAGNAARDSAKQLNSPYGTILTTTTGDTGDRDASYVYSLVSTATPFNEYLFDAKDHKDLTSLIARNTRASDPSRARIMVNITMSHRQLGYSDEWMYEKIQETVAEGGNADRDLFNVWTSGTATSPIPKIYIENFNKSVIDDPYIEIYNPHNYIIRWYITEEEKRERIDRGHSFIIGVDTSDGVGRDDITFVVRDHTSGEIIAVAAFNETNLISVADFFADFLMRYPNAVMIPERRSSAATIIDYMIQKLCANNINPFKKIYNTIVQNKNDNEKEFNEINKPNAPHESIVNKYRKYLGFTTSATGSTSRNMLYSSTLINMSKYTSTYTYDKELIRQITTLVVKNNRVDHVDGGHDDLVIAALLSYWFLTTGQNLSFYDIDTSKLLKNNKPFIDEKYSQSNLDKYEIEEIEARIQKLLEDYKEEKDEIVLEKIQTKIKALAKELNINFNVNIAVEQLIQEVNQEKKSKNKYWQNW